MYIEKIVQKVHKSRDVRLVMVLSMIYKAYMVVHGIHKVCGMIDMDLDHIEVFDGKMGPESIVVKGNVEDMVHR